MVNNLRDAEKLNNAALVYNPCTINQIGNQDIHMTIPDYLFLEVLLIYGHCVCALFDLSFICMC